MSILSKLDSSRVTKYLKDYTNIKLIFQLKIPNTVIMTDFLNRKKLMLILQPVSHFP